MFIFVLLLLLSVVQHGIILKSHFSQTLKASFLQFFSQAEKFYSAFANHPVPLDSILK